MVRCTTTWPDHRSVLRLLINLSRILIMFIAKYLREVARKCRLAFKPTDETRRLRAENKLLRSSLKRAHAAMASAPIWHTQHRVISQILIDLKKKLTRVDRTVKKVSDLPAA